jgi:hypothetical protein
MRDARGVDLGERVLSLFEVWWEDVVLPFDEKVARNHFDEYG